MADSELMEENLDFPMEEEELIIKMEPDDVYDPLAEVNLSETDTASSPDLENYHEAVPTTASTSLEMPAPMLVPKIEPDSLQAQVNEPTRASTSSQTEKETDEARESTERRRMPITRRCCVRGCTSVGLRKEGGGYFAIPTNPTRRSLWLKLINRMDLYNKPIAHICKKHFVPSDIIKTANNKNLLKFTAVPVLNIPYKTGTTKAIQAIHILFDNCTQTDYTNMESKAVQITSDEPGMLRNDEIKKEIAECKKRLKSLEHGAHKTQIVAFNNWCDRFLPQHVAKFVKAQAILKLNNKGNRYDHATKALSLNLYYTSTQAYDFLRKNLCLPLSRSLKRLDVPVSTEYNVDIMTALKMKVDSMSEREKYCTVIVDLMKLRASLSYVIKKDKIVGLHDVNGCQSLEPAQYAIVIFVRGLIVSWSQPIAFALLSESKRHSQVSQWIDTYLMKLLDIGLKIKTFVPTFKSDLLNEEQHRSISVDKPYFFVNNTKIYYVFDVPDMLKELRDTFLDNEFHFRKGNDVSIAAATHVIEFMKHDLKKKLRLVPKLTVKHLYPTDSARKQVRYAAELLSRSVATALEMHIDFEKIVGESGRDTVYFLSLINNLFDILNSSSLKEQQYKRAFCGDNTQKDLLKECLDFFQTLRICKRKGGNTCQPKFIKGFLITIKSVLLLFEDLKLEGHEHLLTRHLHLEVSKKFFRTIKTKAGGMVVIPTSKIFLGVFRELYLSYLLKPPKQQNCSRGLAKFLSELNEAEDKEQDEDSTSQSNSQTQVPLVDSPQSVLQSVSDGTSFFAELKVSHETSIGEFCCTLLKGCLEHHKNCERLKCFVESFDGAYGVSDNNDLAMTSEMISPVYFVSFIETLDKEFCAAVEMIETNNNIGLATYERIKDIVFAPPCPCFPNNYLKVLFIRLRIYMIVNFNTEVYRNNYFDGEQVVIPKLCMYD